jgi:hypothetical protein
MAAPQPFESVIDELLAICRRSFQNRGPTRCRVTASGRPASKLAPDERSDRWRTWATGPKGETIEGEGDGPIAALNAVAREPQTVRASASR